MTVQYQKRREASTSNFKSYKMKKLLTIRVARCQACRSTRCSTYSAMGDYVTFNCRDCGTETKSKFEYHKVLWPTVIFEGTEVRHLEHEVENFYIEKIGYEFGVNITCHFNEYSTKQNEVKTFYNITEFHYLFDTIAGDEKFAMESDLHGHGGTKNINEVSKIVIRKADRMYASYYGDAIYDEEQPPFHPYATIYRTQSNGVTHGCVHYTKNDCRYGAYLVAELKRIAYEMPIFDITNCTRILGLSPDNIIKYGGQQIK